MTAPNETLVETLWACRQFIVDHVHSGEEWPIILRIDKDLVPPCEVCGRPTGGCCTVMIEPEGVLYEMPDHYTVGLEDV